jgi:hypothetical protein
VPDGDADESANLVEVNDDPLADFRRRNRRPLRRLTKFKQVLRRNHLRNYPL